MSVILPDSEWGTSLVAEYCDLEPARITEHNSRHTMPRPVRRIESGRNGAPVWRAADIVEWRGPLSAELVMHDAWGKLRRFAVEWLPRVFETPDAGIQLRSLVWGPNDCPVRLVTRNGRPHPVADVRSISGQVFAPVELGEDDERNLLNDGDPLWGCFRVTTT